MADFYKFAEEAIEMAGEAGERKRKQALTIQQKGARSRLAEIERSETGATRRQAMIEAGIEARHKREYGRPWGARPEAQQGFRYAELEAKKSAGARLSAANQRQKREQMFEDYDIKTSAMLSPLMEYGPEGETMIPPQLRNIYNVGKAMSLEDPEGAIRYVEKEIGRHEETQTRLDRLRAMSDEEFSAYEKSLSGGMKEGITPAAVAPRKKPGAEAARLRAEYEKEYPTPIIGAETLGRLGEAWRKREESPYVRLGR